MGKRVWSIGSSPRGRGTHIPRHGDRDGARFIPARAGNTRSTPRSASRASVHPRAGGEHAGTGLRHGLRSGSSPRGRGTPLRDPLVGAADRFIPARAGNTPCAPASGARRSVHPRAGGEHEAAICVPNAIAGSSPRGRGTRLGLIACAALGRFIPARAGNTSRRPSPMRAAPVHPRAGGEHVGRDCLAHRAVGSSPRGRGTRAPVAGCLASDRFIPARAGNTITRASRAAFNPVHPRAGGEHASTINLSTVFDGSSPRGRGTQRLDEGVLPELRFIPARAGNTPRRGGRRTATAVHPRAGGEHEYDTGAAGAWDGSSPRGRGTPRGAGAVRAVRRFIPARAGNTGTDGTDPAGSSVHPRAGGEHFIESEHFNLDYGSSPRGRGTLRRDVRRAVRRRFIPARAGNTRRGCRPSGRRPVHPRAGGEHIRRFAINRSVCGSSPRGRGTPTRGCLQPGHHRFIPARAGNTTPSASSARRATVHPRAGGEHVVLDLERLRSIGSSPRGRGTPSRHGFRIRQNRFIPARAGNTR